MLGSAVTSSLIFSIINLLQLFFYLLVISVEYPPNAKMFLDIFSMSVLKGVPSPIEIFTGNLTDHSLDSPVKFREAGMDGLFL